MTFDAEKYWANKERKTWVVYLKTTSRIKGKKYTHTDTKYIWAKTSSGAIRTAIHHSPLKGRISVSTRLATPSDLGCY